MLGTLIQKEILTNIFSFRFVAVFALLLVVVPVTVLVLTNDDVKKARRVLARRNGDRNYLKSLRPFQPAPERHPTRASRPFPFTPWSGASPRTSTSRTSTTIPCRSCSP